MREVNISSVMAMGKDVAATAVCIGMGAIKVLHVMEIKTADHMPIRNRCGESLSE